MPRVDSPADLIPLAIAARVLAVPEAQLQAERIKGGLTNESWCVSVVGQPERAVVVRLSNTNEAQLQLNRHSEAVVLKRVEAAGIGAPVLLCEPDQHVLVTRRVLASVPEASHLQQPAFIQAIAGLLRTLHALSLPEKLQSQIQQVDLLHFLHGYWHSLEQAGVPITAAEREHATGIARESAQVGSRCLCHNDVHHLNLLGDANRLWLLDWEYAGIGDPLFDLAAVCVYHDFDSSRRDELLVAYRGEWSFAEAQRLARMCWLFDYIRTLWLRVRERCG